MRRQRRISTATTRLRPPRLIRADASAMSGGCGDDHEIRFDPFTAPCVSMKTVIGSHSSPELLG